MRQGVAHSGVVSISQDTQTERKFQPTAPPLLRSLCKSGIGKEVDAAVVIVGGGQTLHEAATLRAVGVVSVLNTRPQIEFERQAPKNALKTQFVFRLLRLVIKELGLSGLVADVFITPIVQHVSAQHPAIGVLSPQHLIDCTYRVVPLVVSGQKVQQKAASFVGIGIQICVQPHLVQRSQSNDRKIASVADTIVVFELEIVVSRQKGEIKPLKEHLQVGLTHRSYEGGAGVERAVECQRSIGSPQRDFRMHTVTASFLHANIQHRTQCIGTIGGESPRIEIDGTHQVGIENPHSTTGRTLC